MNTARQIYGKMIHRKMFIGLLRCAVNYWGSSWRSHADRRSQIGVPFQARGGPWPSVAARNARAARVTRNARATGPAGSWRWPAGAYRCMRVQGGVVRAVRGGVQTHLFLWWALGDQTA